MKKIKFILGLSSLMISLFACPNNSKAKQIDGVFVNDLGKGINLIGNKNKPIVNATIFDLTDNDYDYANKNQWFSQKTSYIGIKNFINSFSLNTNLSISANIPVLNSGIADKLEINDNLKYSEYHNTLFYRYRSNHILKQVYLKDSAYSDYYSTKLSSKLLEEIEKLNNNCNEYTMNEFINNFGTHVILGENYGSSLDYLYKYYSNGRMIKNNYSQAANFDSLFSANVDDIEADINFISNTVLENSTLSSAYTNSEKSIIYGIGGDPIYNTKLTKSVFDEWKKTESYKIDCISYPEGCLRLITDYFPSKYSNLKFKLSHFISSQSGYKIKCNDQLTTTVHCYDTGCFDAGGGHNIAYSNLTDKEYKDFKLPDLSEYSAFRIRISLDMKRGTSDLSHISLKYGDTYLAYWNDIHLSKGWNRYEHTYYYGESEYIPVSLLGSNQNLVLKFDGSGNLKYTVGTRIIDIEFIS